MNYPHLTAVTGYAPPPIAHIVRGVDSFPVDTPPENIVLGGGWLRRGETATLIGTAGQGKSALINAACMAWAAGLPFLGITPPGPLRILLAAGEDDGTAFGQVREGLKNHAKEICGCEITEHHLALMLENLRTDFSREATGLRFFSDRLSEVLEDDPIDLLVVNPLYSFIGGDLVQHASEWLRCGMAPLTQAHNCASIVASHTPVMRAKDAWDTTSDTYAATGGGEMANFPRSIMVLRPTKTAGLFVLTTNKRKFWWPDGNGPGRDHLFLRQSGNPQRPAWIPVPYDDEILEEVTQHQKKAAKSKVGTADVVAFLQDGDQERGTVLEHLKSKYAMADTKAKTVIRQAIDEGVVVVTGTAPRPGGGHPIDLLGLPPTDGRRDGRDD